MTRDEIVAAARRYCDLRPKWRHRGRTEQQLDCAGLLWRLQHVDFGIPTEDVDGYGRYPMGDAMIEHLRKVFVYRAAPPKPGSILVIRDNCEPCHVGVMGERFGQLTMIHCAVKSGMREDYWTRDLRKDFRMALDFKGIED